MKRILQRGAALATIAALSGGIYVAGFHAMRDEWPWSPPPDIGSVVRAAASTAAGQQAGASPTAAATSTAEPADLEAPPAHGTLVEATIDSAAMHGQLPLRVYLPPGYDAPANRTTRFPVVYLLHGAPGSYTDWIVGGHADTTLDAMIAAGAFPPAIMVMPDGRLSFTSDSEWADGSPPADQAERYVTSELVPFVDATYRTVADAAHRSIGGLSSGAYGAVNIALHHPELFGSAWGLSGTYHAPTTLLGQPLCADDACKAYNSPVDYVARMPDPQRLRVFLSTGLQDTLDNTVDETRTLQRALDTRQVPNRTVYAEGGHSWHFWAQQLVGALAYVAGGPGWGDQAVEPGDAAPGLRH